MPGAELATRSTAPVTANGVALAKSDTVPSWVTSLEEHLSWQVLAELRVTLRVGVALHRFRVRDILDMREGQIFETLSPTTEDVPLMVGRVQLGWSEFEAVEQRMALRLTRLS